MEFTKLKLNKVSMFLDRLRFYEIKLENYVRARSARNVIPIL